METFAAKKFEIPELRGISAKTTEEHLKLYAGYVRHANLILDEIARNQSTGAEATYAVAEMQRRFAFEFGGIRNHEVYFGSFENGAVAVNPNSALAAEGSKKWPSYDAWLAKFKALAMTRGPGWAMLVYDPNGAGLLHSWVDEQHLGHLPGTVPILALDMWEHSYVADYQPSGKGKYIDDFFANLNWKFIEDRFETAQKCAGH
ncbi:MAG TPA: Fe-Mn family superoxide dismutase [Candidatus Paceibacterota bacterium]